MLIVYEKIEDFFAKLKKLPKETQLFVSTAKPVSETGVMVPYIVIQMLKGDTCYMIRHTEDMKPFQLASGVVFDVIPDEGIRKSAYDSYSGSYDAFEKNLQDDYKKTIEIIKGMGFTDIENAIIQ